MEMPILKAIKKSKTPAKKTITTIFVMLILTTAALMTNLQFTSADVLIHPTHAYVDVSANPVGVSQTIVVTFRVEEVNPLTSGIFASEVWRGFTVTITKPDGKNDTKVNLSADPTGGSFFYYVPTQVGNYTFVAYFPGQWVNGSYRTVGLNGGAWSNSSTLPLKSAQWYYVPSVSAPVTMVVQQDPIPAYPDVPLPNNYWTRPIYAEDKGWYTIADNWLMPAYDRLDRPFQNGAAFAPLTSAPNSAHILWTKPVTFGGIAGGSMGDKSFYHGLSYETLYDNKEIFNGRIYYQDHDITNTYILGTDVLDLYTGKEIMYMNNTRIDLAESYDAEHPNKHGVVDLLWSLTGTASNGTWLVYDAFTGRQIFTITNVTSGSDGVGSQSKVFGSKGELLSYSTTGTGASRRMLLWNSTKAIMGPDIPDPGPFTPAQGAVFDGRRGIEWNVSIPDMQLEPSIVGIGEGYLLLNAQDKSYYPELHQDAAYPAILSRDASGQYPAYVAPLWMQNRTDVFANFQRTTRNIHDGVYTMWDEANCQWYGYSLATGQKLWVTDPLSTSNSWTSFTFITNQAYGMLFAGGFDGHVRAWNITNGKLMWDYYMGPSGFETPYGHWPTRAGWTIADGKLFVTNDDHTPDANMWRGSRLRVLDVYTGQVLYSISGMLRMPAISDGILTAINSYDNQIYTFGKGPSSTKVTATPKTPTAGSAVLMEGTVTDISVGTSQLVQSARFPNGVPAVSDESESAWMEYVYEQKPKPSNVTGVNVQLTITGPDGTNYGAAAVSDDQGKYATEWTPPAPGIYKVTAAFAGSNSYWPSTDETFFSASKAPSPVVLATPTPVLSTQTPTPTLPPTPATPAPSVPVQPPTQEPSIAIYVGIAAIIIIAAILAVAVLLRRRK